MLVRRKGDALSTRERDEHHDRAGEAPGVPEGAGPSFVGAVGNRAFAGAVAGRSPAAGPRLDRDLAGIADAAAGIGLGLLGASGPFGALMTPTAKALIDQYRKAPPGAHKGVTGITDVRASWGFLLTDTLTGSRIDSKISPEAPFTQVKQELDASVGPGRYTLAIKLGLGIPAPGGIGGPTLQSQSEASWRIRVTPDGKASIEADALQTVAPSVGNDVMLTGINPGTNLAGERSGFMISPVLTGPSGSSSVSQGVQGGAEGGGLSGGVSGSGSVGINTPNVSMQRGLRVNIETKAALATKHTAFFKIADSKLLDGELENMRKWYKSLDESLRKSVEDGTLDVFVTGYASTTGATKGNQQLAKDRAAEVARFVVQFTSSKAKITEAAEGELAQQEQKGEDRVERQEFRRADITVGGERRLAAPTPPKDVK
jgi:hypothetical protein